MLGLLSCCWGEPKVRMTYIRDRSRMSINLISTVRAWLPIDNYGDTAVDQFSSINKILKDGFPCSSGPDQRLVSSAHLPRCLGNITGVRCDREIVSRRKTSWQADRTPPFSVDRRNHRRVEVLSSLHKVQS